MRVWYMTIRSYYVQVMVRSTDENEKVLWEGFYYLNGGIGGLAILDANGARYPTIEAAATALLTRVKDAGPGNIVSVVLIPSALPPTA